jgi:hypothetical protein
MPEQASSEGFITDSGHRRGTGATLASVAAAGSALAGIELLPASAAIHDGSGFRSWLCFPLRGQAVLPDCISPFDRVRVLSSEESEEVPAPACRVRHQHFIAGTLWLR